MSSCHACAPRPEQGAWFLSDCSRRVVVAAVRECQPQPQRQPTSQTSSAAPPQGTRRAWEERVAEAPPWPERANPLLSSPRPDGRPRGGLLLTEALKVQLLFRVAEGRPTAVITPPTTVLGIFCVHAQNDLKITRLVVHNVGCFYRCCSSIS